MTKNEFIKHYSITDTTPIDPSRKSLPAEAFSSAIAEFMEERFGGAVKVRCDTISAQAILVCAEYAAFFLKTLLTDVYGRAFLNIDIKSDESGLHIVIGAEDKLPVSEQEMRELIRLARNAGFEISCDSGTIMLSVAFSPATVRRVYAVSIFDGKRVMLGKLVEIFCHGELMSAEPSPEPILTDPINRKGNDKK